MHGPWTWTVVWCEPEWGEGWWLGEGGNGNICKSVNNKNEKKNLTKLYILKWLQEDTSNGVEMCESCSSHYIRINIKTKILCVPQIISFIPNNLIGMTNKVMVLFLKYGSVFILVCFGLIFTPIGQKKSLCVPSRATKGLAIVMVIITRHGATW